VCSLPWCRDRRRHAAALSEHDQHRVDHNRRGVAANRAVRRRRVAALKELTEAHLIVVSREGHG